MSRGKPPPPPSGGFFGERWAQLWCCCTDDNQAPESIALSTAFNNADSVSSLALCQACHDGNVQSVESLLRIKADVNCPRGTESQCYGGTPLILASRAGHENVVSLLLKEEGLDVTATSEDAKRSGRSKQTALIWAARKGHEGVCRLLLQHPKVNVNAVTAARFSAMMIAAQQGHADVVELLLKDPRTDVKYFFEFDGRETMSPLTMAILEGQTSVVQALVADGRIEFNELLKFSYGLDTPLGNAVHLHRTQIVGVLLAAKANPHVPNADGILPLLNASESGSTEALILLLLFGAYSPAIFSELRHAQILGDGAEVCRIAKEDMFIQHSVSEVFPNMHLYTVLNDTMALQKEVQHAIAHDSCTRILDGGGLPAIFYALDLGLVEVSTLLLANCYDFPEEIVSGMLAVAKQGPAQYSGQNVWKAMRVLLDSAWVRTHEAHNSQGLLEMMHTFVGSFLALRYFFHRPDEFAWLRRTVADLAHDVYTKADDEVGHDELVKLSVVVPSSPATPSTAETRQDDPGRLPAMEYVWNEATGAVIGGDHEFYTAMSYALLADSLKKVFEVDMKETFALVADKIVCASPKGYARMYNRLQDPSDLGDHSIRSPRSAKNLDLLRATVALQGLKGFPAALEALRARYEVLQIENHYDPELKEQRCVRVNFAFRPGLSLAEVFGTGVYNYEQMEHLPGSDAARIWLTYTRSLCASSAWSWALEGLWRAAALHLQRPISIVAELILVHEPYVQVREYAELLRKVSCAGSPVQMTRDFCLGLARKRPETERLRRVAVAIATTVRKTKQL